MLVINVAPGMSRAQESAVIQWSGRRHDDDGPGATRGQTHASLFDAIFHALHDGEQVAVGFPGPLSVPAPIAQDAAIEDRALASLADAVDTKPAVAHLAELLCELGKWRPWTVASTSIPRWRATTSLLVWESAAAGAPDPTSVDDLDTGVQSFYDLVRTRAEHGAEARGASVLNLAAAAALRGQLTVELAQLSEPVVLIPARSHLSASA